MCLPLANLEEVTLSKGEHVGFEWQTVHNNNQHRCGYIKVLPGHPWFGKGYSCDCDDHYSNPDAACKRLESAEVHGGITFAAHGKACPTHGEEAEWWVGFDCAHSGDAADPSLPSSRRLHNDALGIAREISDAMDGIGGSREWQTIRTTDYVEAQCRSLCEQAATANRE